MKKFASSLLISVVLVSLFLAACAPKAVMNPPPSPTLQVPAQSNPVNTTLITNPQNEAWMKVEEAAKKEGRVTLYANTFTGDRSIALTQAFKQKYGITAEILLGRGAEYIERLKTERRSGAITGDIFEGSATHLGNAKLAHCCPN